MDQHLKETTGFICRWLLLAVSAAGILAAAGATAASLTSLTLSRSGGLAVSDAFGGEPGKKAWIVARAVDQSMSKRNNAMFSILSADGSLRLHSGYKGASYRMVRTPAGSPRRVKLIPAPYGPMPFRTFEARSATIPSEREVWIVDARLLEKASVAELASAVDALPAADAVLVVQSGSLKDRGQQGLAVRRTIPRALIFSSLGKTQAFRPTFRRVRAGLDRLGNRGLHVVTSSGEDALALAHQGVSVYLVGGTVDEPGAPPNLHTYRDIRMFQESLVPSAIDQ